VQADIRIEPETLKDLLGPAPTPIWITDSGLIVFVNQAAIATLGGSRADQFLSRCALEFIDPSSHGLARERMHARYENGSAPGAVEENFLTLQGEIVPVLVTNIPFTWEGRPAQQVHFTDLRPVKRAQQAAEASRAQIDFLTDKVPALIAYLDRDLRYLSANHAHVSWTGEQPDKLVGKHVDDIIRKHIAPAEWESAENALQACLSGTSCTLLFHANYGSQDRIVQAHYAPDINSHGEVSGVIMLVVDVTEQRRAEKELEFRATLLEEALEPIFAWELPGPMTYWNRAAEELYGYSQSEALGHSSHDLLQTRSPVPIAEIERTLAEEGVWQGYLHHITKRGENLIVEARLRALRSGGVMYVIECIRDATQRVRAEEDLRAFTATLESRIAERTEALTQANADLQAYAYTISHDLRAPLRTMQGFANALIEDYTDVLDVLGKRYLERIGAAAERMDQLISDLLEYSRLGRDNLRLDRVDLTRVVQDVLGQHQAAITRSGATISVDPDLPCVKGHYTTLVQIVGNLLSNAIKFHRAGVPPKVRIEARRSPGQVRLFVCDEGIGVGPEHQSRIFQVFERLHGQESYPGTGIGLAIVKRGVERLGGAVGIHSKVEGGSSFFIDLPEAATV
jgi:PAS domain S-box-containing protein